MQMTEEKVYTPPAPKPVYEACKRIFDIVMCVLALIVLSPLFLAVAIAIKCEDGGKVFFKQQRMTKGGKVFGMYKFRSMIPDAEEKLSELLDRNEMDGPAFKMQDDPRITKVGKFIRKTSIDELPQLVNIIKGEMSIIGPRPLMKDYLPLYNERHKHRHDVRPGLACWNLNSGNKLTPESFTWNAQFESDIYYVEHCSFWLDVKMVFKTVQIVFSKSEMRTNSDRVKFNGENLLETRSRKEILEAEQSQAPAPEETTTVSK